MGNTVPYFTEWFTQTVSYKKLLSKDGVGQGSYDDSKSLSCYTFGDIQKVTDDKGKEVISFQKIYLDGSDSTVAGIDFGDIFKIGDRYRPIKSISKFYDEDGDLDLVVIYL